MPSRRFELSTNIHVSRRDVEFELYSSSTRRNSAELRRHASSDSHGSSDSADTDLQSASEFLAPPRLSSFAASGPLYAQPSVAFADNAEPDSQLAQPSVTFADTAGPGSFAEPSCSFAEGDNVPVEVAKLPAHERWHGL